MRRRAGGGRRAGRGAVGALPGWGHPGLRLARLTLPREGDGPTVRDLERRHPGRGVLPRAGLAVRPPQRPVGVRRWRAHALGVGSAVHLTHERLPLDIGQRVTGILELGGGVLARTPGITERLYSPTELVEVDDDRDTRPGAARRRLRG